MQPRDFPSNEPATPMPAGRIGIWNRQLGSQPAEVMEVAAELYGDQMKAVFDLYETGEERYGFLGARVYSWTSRVRKPTYGYVIQDVLSKNPASVLDIGCGTGDVLLQLARLDPEVECYGIDPSPAMLRIATKNIARAASSQRDLHNLEERIHLSLGSSRFIPFEKEFDSAFSTYSFHEWADREQSVPTILRKLKKDGTFAVYEYESDSIPSFFKLLFGKHMLTHNEVESISFEGVDKVVDVHDGLVALKFKWFGHSSQSALTGERPGISHSM